MDYNGNIIDIGGEKFYVEIGKSLLEDVDKAILEIKASLDKAKENSNYPGLNIDTNNSIIQVAPWGTGNAFPSELISSIDESYKAQNLIIFNCDQLFGKGPVLIDSISTEENYDEDVMKWLKGWKYVDYLLACISDYYTYLNCFSYVVATNAGTLGYKGSVNKIDRLEFIDAKNVRLQMMNDNGIIENAVIGNWDEIKNLKKVPIFANKTNLDPISVYHAKRKIAYYSYYSYPVYSGLFKTWLNIAKKIPQFHSALLDNGINAKYHIEIAKDYIDAKVEEAQTKAQSGGSNVNDISFSSVLEDIKKELSTKLDEVMTGVNNAGKYFVSAKGKDHEGKSMSYVTITPIDNKIKELSESHLKLNEQVNSEYCSAFGVDPALASIYIGGKMSSGSEILNSYNVHQQSKTAIPRYVVLSAINEAIAINFPEKNVELTFKNTFLVKQESSKSGVDGK